MKQAAPAFPYWLLPWCLVLFLFPFKQLIPGPPFMVVELGAAFVLLLAPRAGASLSNGRFLAVAFLMLAVCVSYFFSLAPADSRMPVLRVGVAFLTYLMATSVVLERHEFIHTLRAWMWGGAAASTALLLAFRGGMATDEGRAIMAIGAYVVEPNYFAQELILPFAIGLYFLMQRGRRLEATVAMSLILGATVATQSRGGVLAMLVVVVALLIFHRRWLWLSLGGATLVGLYLAFAPYMGRFNLASDPTGSKRTLIWQVMIPKALEHWPTGIGLDATMTTTALISGFYVGISPHNTYIQAFLETGLAGLVGLAAAMATHLAIRGEPSFTWPLRAGLWGMAVSGLFLHLLAVQSLWVPWIVAAQAAAMYGVASRDPRGRASRAKPQLNRLPPTTSLNEGV